VVGPAQLLARAGWGWEHLVWRSIHLIFVGALVLTLVVVFALACRWYLRQGRRRKKGGGPTLLSPTGYPIAAPAEC
jgi:hypothetical protein